MRCLVSKWERKEGNNLTGRDLIRINPKKPVYGSLMLISPTTKLVGGFTSKRNKVGFIVGSVKDLLQIIDEYELKEGMDYSEAVFPVKIVTLEKLESETPQNKGFQEKINPSSGEVLTKDGEVIYWKTEVVREETVLEDAYIEHDSGVIGTMDEIEEFQGEVSGKIEVSLSKKLTK